MRGRTLTSMRNLTRFFALAAFLVATTSCGDVVRSGRAPVIMVIDSLLGIRGAVTPGTASNVLTSDVLTNVTSPPPCTPQTPCPTIFGDSGTIVLRLVPKDIGTASNPNAASSNNAVTITSYHVAYRRTDGRNTPGVDIPYSFDGAVTGTVPAAGTAQLGFALVRNQAKAESPLVQLVTNPSIMTVLADVTFYGKDLVGNDISASGTIQINFGNFGDF